MVKKVGFPLPHFFLPDEIRLLHHAWFTLALHLAHFGVLLLGTHPRQGLPDDVVPATPSRESGPQSRLSRNVCCISSKHHAGFMTPPTPSTLPPTKGKYRVVVHTSGGLLLGH